MECNSLRASSIQTYQDCQFKYYLYNVAGFESKTARKALLGTTFHHVQELLAKAKRNKHYLLQDRFTDITFLADICWAHYNKEFPGLMKPEEDYKTLHKLCAKAWDSNYNPLKLNIIDIEKQFEIEVIGKGFQGSNNEPFKLRGTIDLITEDDSDTLHVIDWKTGKRTAWVGNYLKDEETLKNDIQFQVYDIARRAIYPQYKYCLFTVIYISETGPYTFTFNDTDLPASYENVRRELVSIKNNDNPQRLMDNPQRKNELFKCKHVCQFGHKTNLRDSPCQKYYKLFTQYQDKELQQIAIDSTCTKVSRRNDYNQAGIFKGSIKV